MKNACDYLEEALEKMGDISYTKKADKLKISKSTLSMYRSGNRNMDDYACIMVARELGLDPLEVIAAANMERERTTERKDFWEDFRKQIGITGLAGLLVVGMMTTPQSARASELKAPPLLDSIHLDSVHYVK